MVELVYHKPIPGFDGYTASYEGDIYSWKKGRPYKLAHFISGNGYRNVPLVPSKGNRGINRGIHTFTAKAWLPNPNNYPIVNHKDANKENNRVDNLEWVTHRENVLHARRNGLGVKGRKVYQLDISFGYPGTIINEFKSIKEAAKKTGINNRTISQVCTAKSGVRTDGYRAGRKTAGGFGWCYKEDFGNLTESVHGCSRTVEQYTIEGKFIKSYSSLKEAAKAVGKSHSNISNVCTGKQKTCGGFIWKYGKQKKRGKSDLENETKEWKILKRFPGHKISKDGRVYSISYRKTLVGSVRPDGRRSVTIADKDGKLITIAVYRLVAQAYLPNPNKYKKVNHLDHDPSNDNVENLEWCDHRRDSQYTYDMELNKQAKPVLQFSLNGKTIIKRYKSASEACKVLKLPQGSLSNVLNGRNQTCHGFRWCYETE